MPLRPTLKVRLRRLTIDKLQSASTNFAAPRRNEDPNNNQIVATSPIDEAVAAQSIEASDSTPQIEGAIALQMPMQAKRTRQKVEQFNAHKVRCVVCNTKFNTAESV